MEDGQVYADRFTLERIVKARSGHVPVPIADRREARRGAIRGGRRRRPVARPEGRHHRRRLHRFLSAASPAHFDERAHRAFPGRGPARIHRARLHCPVRRPFDLFDPDRKGRIKLYVKRVFITDEADIPAALPALRARSGGFRADLPLNVSRGDDPGRACSRAIKKGITSRVLGDLEKLAEKEPDDLCQDLGRLRPRAEGRHLRGFRAPRRIARPCPLQDHRLDRAMAKPEGLCRRAQGEPDRDLLSRRRRPRAA